MNNILLDSCHLMFDYNLHIINYNLNQILVLVESLVVVFSELISVGMSLGIVLLNKYMLDNLTIPNVNIIVMPALIKLNIIILLRSK